MKGFNLSATSAEDVYKYWKSGDMDEAKARIEGTKSNGAESTEVKLLGHIESIKADIAEFGSAFTPYKGAVIAGIDKIADLIVGDKKRLLAMYDTGTTMEALGGGSNAPKASDILYQAFADKSSEEYADRATEIQKTLAGLDPATQNRINSDPVLFDKLFRDLQNVEDLTDEFVTKFKQTLNEIAIPTSITPEDAKKLGLGQEWNAAIDSGDANALQYAASVWERYGNMTDYRVKKSDEFLDVQKGFGERKADGLTGAEIGEVSSVAIDNYSERRREAIEKLKFYEDSLGSGNLARDTKSDEFVTLLGLLGKARSTEISAPEHALKSVNEAIVTAASSSSPGGAVVTNDEMKSLIAAIRDLVPALKEASTMTVSVE
jgi:hypothetical protein